MMTLRQSVDIDAPPEVVFAYVTDLSTLAEWIPAMVETRDSIGEGEGRQYEWTYKLAGMLFSGESVVIEEVPNRRSVHQSIGAVRSTWTLQVEPRDDGSRFILDVAYEVPVPVLGRLAERIILERDRRDLEAALANVKGILES